MPGAPLHRLSRDRVLTGLIGGLARFLGIDPGFLRLLSLILFIASILVGAWILVLVIYILLSALIPREDDPEDVRGRGFVVDIRRIIYSLLSLLFLGIGIAILIYSIALFAASLGAHLALLVAPPIALAGLLGMIISIFGVIVGILISWIGMIMVRKL
jgi:phage shock protein PspC (stress-responsive transcriptional regulator)